MIIEDWGLIDYREAWGRQKKAFVAAIENRDTPHKIFIAEHPPVYTIGFHGDSGNVTVSEAQLRSIGAECIRIERGGDVTFHGPGQIVIYPILNLRKLGLGARKYVDILQEAVMTFLKRYSIETDIDAKAPGVWIDASSRNARKICALGVKISHGITMHGLALNVNTDLNYFSYINPCGFTDRGVTSMERELGHKIENVSECAHTLAGILASILNANANHAQ